MMEKVIEILFSIGVIFLGIYMRKNAYELTKKFHRMDYYGEVEPKEHTVDATKFGGWACIFGGLVFLFKIMTGY